MALIKRVDRITERLKQPVYYTDFDTKFDLIHNRDLSVVQNETSVLQALHNVIMTNPGERLYNPLFGCNLRELLFENITPQTQAAMKDYIQTAIENYEKRVRVHKIVTDPDTDQNSVYVAITFSLLNKQEPLSLEFVLTRIR